MSHSIFTDIFFYKITKMNDNNMLESCLLSSWCTIWCDTDRWDHWDALLVLEKETGVSAILFAIIISSLFTYLLTLCLAWI